MNESYCENLESASDVLPKLSPNFHPSQSVGRDPAGNRWYIACESIYYRDLTSCDRLSLKKLWSLCSFLGQNCELPFRTNEKALCVVESAMARSARWQLLL